MDIGEKIKKVRELRDYSQEYMAIQLKMTQGGYSNLEQSGDPTYSKLKKIAAIFDLSLTDLINFDEKKIFSSYLGNITGDNNTITESNIISDKLLEEELKAQYNARLLEKDKEIVFLRAMLEKTMDK